MGQIAYTRTMSAGRGAIYTATTTIAGRHVTLHHYYLDTYASLAALRQAAEREAPGLLKAFHYTDEEIAAWHTQDAGTEEDTNAPL